MYRSRTRWLASNQLILYNTLLEELIYKLITVVVLLLDDTLMLGM